MRAQVDEEDITTIRVDRPQVVKMTLYSFKGRSFDGRVTGIYDKADPDRRTFEVDVALAVPDAKLTAAGMTGELAFIVEQLASAPVVPSQAVLEKAVWIVKDGRLHKTDATIGIHSIEPQPDSVGIDLRPLRVVISPIKDLHEGQSVRTTYMDPAEAAAVNRPKAAEAPAKIN